MRRLFGRAFAAVAVLGCAVSAGPGCVHTDTSMFIKGVLTPPIPQAGVCRYAAPDGNAVTLFSGVLDGSLAAQYQAVLLVGSQLRAANSIELARSEVNRVILQGATVRVTDSTGKELNSFTRLGSGSVEPGASTSPSYGMIQTTLVDPKSVQLALEGITPGETRRVVSYARVFGQTLGGVAVETNEYQFPIDICFRCLIKFGPDTVDKVKAETEKRTNCAAVPTAAFEGCTLGQDLAVPCNQCPGRDVCDPFYSGAVKAAAP